MSTRAHIVIEGHPVMIYKHSDGYPEGVLPVLSDLVLRFNQQRGIDHEYLAAQIVRAFAFDDADHDADSTSPALYNHRPAMTGWGLDTAMHGDEEYIYLITNDGKQYTIEGRVPTGEFWGNPIIENTEVPA